MSVELFSGALDAVAFKASKALALQGERFSLDFSFAVDVGVDAKIEFYLEFSEDNVTWFREMTQQVQANGSVKYIDSTASLRYAADADWPDGASYTRCLQFQRAHLLARVQLRATAGVVSSMIVRAPFGILAQS